VVIKIYNIIMKKTLKLIALGAIAMIMMSSCATTLNTSSRTSVSLPGITLERSDYKITDDINASAEVKVTFGVFYKGVDRKNLKVGNVSGYGKGIDEKLAIYNLIESNPNVDYLTNIRVLKSYKKGFLGISKTYNTKVIAKGIQIKTDK